MRSSRNTVLALVLLTGLASGGQALAQIQTTNETISAFRSYVDVFNIPINVPTVVELNLDEEFFERFQFAVWDNDNNSFQPSLFEKQTTKIAAPVVITANNTAGSIGNLTDDDTTTFAEFALPEEGQGTAEITIKSAIPITSSRFTLLLDNHVALPTSVEVRAVRDEQEDIIVARKKMTSQTVLYPKTTAAEWRLIFTYGQPLRITELRFNQDNAEEATTKRLRFLAQPGQSYRIYVDADRSINLKLPESGNLAIDEGVLKIGPFPLRSNPAYSQADIDSDGVPDTLDNCTRVENTNQEDVDRNGRGDACDDFDRDGLMNADDNCPNDPNKGQADEDSDGIGDACDGEESRFTEKYPWIPWVGIVLAALVLAVLFALTAKSTIQKSKKEKIPASD